MLYLLLGTLAVAAIFYRYVYKPMRYWKDRGVEQGNPTWIFGHMWDNLLGRKNACDIFNDIYNQSPNARYTGFYRFSTPILTLRDPELIKRITIKDFDYFMDHVAIIPPEDDPLWSKNLLNLTGSKWRDARSYLSPSFTGSKMRTISVLMTECAENLVKHLLKKGDETLALDLRDVFSRYTNDVIATTAFGVKVDSLEKPNNEFYRVTNEVSDLTTVWLTIKLLAYGLMPWITNLMKITIISKKAGNFFSGLIDDTIKAREEKGIVRPDMLHLLLQTRNNLRKQQENSSNTHKGESNGFGGNTVDISNEDITAHAVIFIMAGFESVSNFISFTTYELAVNPQIQEKLRKEVHDTNEKCGGKVTYEDIMNMKYLDMVLSEGMRKWPHFVAINRECTKPYTIEPVTPEEKPVHIEKGTQLILPIYAIQHDPKYFPDPERFDPERFSDENKDKIHPYTNLAFGIGPRACIGARYTLLGAKILLFHLLSRFELVPVGKTMIPLKFKKNTVINLKPVDGFWLGFKRNAA